MLSNKQEEIYEEMKESIRLLLECLENSHPKKMLPELVMRHSIIEAQSRAVLKKAQEV